MRYILAVVMALAFSGTAQAAEVPSKQAFEGPLWCEGAYNPNATGTGTNFGLCPGSEPKTPTQYQTGDGPAAGDSAAGAAAASAATAPGK